MLDASHLIPDLTDDQLMQEISRPSGLAHPMDLATEMQRRTMARTPGYAQGGMVGGVGNFWDIARRAMDVSGNYKTLSADEELRKTYGISGQRENLKDFVDDAGELVPDRTSPVFAELIAEHQKQLDETKRGNRGRALMEMGLAMMSAQGPNFWANIGQGGGAGLAAKDRIKQQERGVMQELMRAKMGQAQAMAGRDASVLNAATGLYGAQEGRWNSFNQGIGQLNATQTNAEMTAANMGQQSYENQLNRALQKELAYAQMAASERNARIGAGDGAQGMRQAKPEDVDQAYKAELSRVQSVYFDKDGKPKRGMKTPDQGQIARRAQAEAAARLAHQGLLPPMGFISSYNQEYGDTGRLSPIFNRLLPQTVAQIAKPGQTGGRAPVAAEGGVMDLSQAAKRAQYGVDPPPAKRNKAAQPRDARTLGLGQRSYNSTDYTGD